MLIFPAIDIYGGKAVRLYKGDYARMTVYSEDPAAVAAAFAEAGATCVHVVDLEGARNGTTPNLDLILRIRRESGLFTEVGGGIRTREAAARYIDSGIDRVILGTAAAQEPELLRALTAEYGERIAAGVDLRDGYVAVNGWTERTALTAAEFFRQLGEAGVNTAICTDISRDGAMRGANTALYRELLTLPAVADYGIRLIASGGVSAIEDVRELTAAGLYGAIIGKAYYTGAIDLREALRIAAGPPQKTDAGSVPVFKKTDAGSVPVFKKEAAR